MLRSVRYCLPDSSHYMSWKSRDFVPGYSRFARYCLPDSSYCARSPSALSPCSKSITDNPDATDLFFSRIFLFGLFFSLGFVCACWALGFSRIYLSLWTSLAICNPAPYRRKYNPKEIQDQVNPKIKRNP